MQALSRVTAEGWALMEEIGRRTAGPGPGITRPAYGAAEQLAMEAVCAWATACGLSVTADGFGNHHVLLPGREEGPAVAAGSHLDSVPNGGNYDGLAGAVAAVAVLAAAHASGGARRPMRAVLMRGEESPWFGTAYLGSRLLLGRSPFAEIGALVRRDTGRTLGDHLVELGYDPAAAPVLDPSQLAAFFELHIEQGPLLLDVAGPAVGIATASRGNIRFPQARCLGEYGHSAALPRSHRRDAVLGVAELALALDAFWARRVALGDDNFVATVGQFCTDPAQHAMTKVAGEVAFTLNLGATDPTTLAEARAVLEASLREIEGRRGVRFALGTEVGTAPVPFDPRLMGLLEASAAAGQVAAVRMPTVGHDAAMFALSGIPAAMVLIRNAHGSHNPAEALEPEDFATGVQVLAEAMLAA